MTPLYNRFDTDREVLMSFPGDRAVPSWSSALADRLKPAGFGVVRAFGDHDAISRVEEGGLAAAVLTDQHQGTALSLVRIIRSINDRLPCYMVTDSASPQVLQAAFSLRVTSVHTQPIDGSALALSLIRALVGPDADTECE